FTNGIDWTASSFLPSSSLILSALTYGNGSFLLLGADYPGIASTTNTVVLSSPNGTTWTGLNIGATRERFLNCIAFGNNRFTAAGYYGNLATSPDGAAWSVQSAATDNNLRSVTFAGSRFVA